MTGWRVPKVHWSGVALPDLLASVGVARRAPRRCSSGRFDGEYTESLTLDQAQAGRRPRRDAHARRRRSRSRTAARYASTSRQMYGYKSLKWLGGIEVSDQVVPGYWEHYGYDVDGWVGRSNGRDDAPIT